MEDRVIDSKATGLRRGDASKIARIHRVSVQHVLEVARGNRSGRPSLLKTIATYRARTSDATPAPAA